MSFPVTAIKRISRPCYDKCARCPGWAGGGTGYAKVTHCESTSLGYDNIHKLRVCHKCGTLVLPYWVRKLDPTWWQFQFYMFRKYTVKSWLIDRGWLK